MPRLHISILALVGLGLASCSEDGEVYERPASEVRELLRTVEVPLYMFGNRIETDAIVDVSDPYKVVWKVTSDDSPLMRFTATLIAEGDTKTRVIVDVEGSTSNRYGDIQAKLAKAKEIRNLYVVSMTEAVDSTLDGRVYDMTATYGAMMGAAAANANRLFPPPSQYTGRPSEPENGR